MSLLTKQNIYVNGIQKTLPTFKYDYTVGPVNSKDQITFPIRAGNCRFAIQLYFYICRGLWLTPEQTLCPALYLSTGCFIQKGSTIDTSHLEEGDIVLAERIRNKDGQIIDRSPTKFSTEEEWIISLHSAIIKNPHSEKDKMMIWHATAIANGVCEWSLREFETHYRIVAIKRIKKPLNCISAVHC